MDPAHDHPHSSRRLNLIRDTAPTRRRNRSMWVALALACAAVVVAGVSYAQAAWHTLTYSCYVDGPRPAFPVDESASVEGSFVFWPLGRACSWTQDGVSQYVGPEHGWVATGLCLAFALGAVGVAASGAARLLMGIARR
jgi:hypothetical protein